MVEACFEHEAPRYLIRDRDGKFGGQFNRRVEALGIEQILTSYRSPWQNPYVERAIGSIRRECLDYYHRNRTHLGLEKDCPVPRSVEPPEDGDTQAQNLWLGSRSSLDLAAG